ncbi:MAG: ATP-binding protein [Acidobacteria bacterium]|nr:ATP-binding protein [Acidobacteriota bacterium]
MAQTREFTLPSEIGSVDMAASAAEDFAKACKVPDEALTAIDLAVRESVANAVKHGNRLDADKNVEITLSIAESVFEIRVRDFGIGFNVDAIPDPTDPANLLSASGRGILFMRSFMDEVEWLRHPEGGMVVRMAKNL